MTKCAQCGKELEAQAIGMEAVAAEGVPTVYLTTAKLVCPTHGANWRWSDCDFAGSTDVTEYAGSWRYCERRDIASVKSPEDCATCDERRHGQGGEAARTR